MTNIRILNCGDSALTVQFGNEICIETGKTVRALTEALETKKIRGIVELIPAFCALTVC